MATATIAKVDTSALLHTDKIVRKLDNFPELLQALRDGDLLTGRLFCAEVFQGFDLRQSHPDEVTPTLQAALKVH